MRFRNRALGISFRVWSQSEKGEARGWDRGHGGFIDKQEKAVSFTVPYLSIKEAEDGGHQKTLKKKNRVRSE